jgi:hypothetical protein
MPTSQNGGPVPSRRRDDLDLAGIINSINAVACSVYLATRSVIIAVTTVAAAALLVIVDLIRRR